MPRSDYSLAIPGSVTSPTGTFTDPMASYSEEVSNGVHRRKPTGWIPPTSYTFSFKRWRKAVGTCISYYIPNPGANTQIYTGVVGGANGRFNSLNHFNEILSESQIVDSTLADIALTKARLNLKRKSVDLGVAFGERKQTARLVGDTATRLAKSIRALKRGEVRRSMAELGISRKAREPLGVHASRKWLELQYGWKPLLSDIYGACDALSRRSKETWRVTAKGTAKSTFRASRSWTSFDRGVGTAEVENRAFARIDALPQNEAKISLASLGITNPLFVAWELVPWSFVVDWFLPIGNYLDSLDALLGYQSAYTSVSLFTKANWRETGTSGERNNFFHNNSYEGSKYIVKLQRSASSGVPLPSFPRLKDPRSLGHMANGIALLMQTFGRR